MPSLFLSHSSRDKFFVQELAQRLQQYGVKVWIDEAEINVGDSLTEKIGRAIDETDYVGVVLSHNSVNSEWVLRELQIALQKELKKRKVVILPILIESVEIPPFLRDKLYADFTSPKKTAQSFAKLLKALGISAAETEVKTEKVEEQPRVTHKVESPSTLTSVGRRLADFEDIQIVDLDEERTHKPDQSYALFNMYLKLSADPPTEWRQIFEAERRFPRHTMWRRAWIEGDYIVIYCVPEELERYHLKDLKEDFRNANRKYREYLTKLAREQARERHKEQIEQEQISDIKRRLNFD